jgi:hypothetical protein
LSSPSAGAAFAGTAGGAAGGAAGTTGTTVAGNNSVAARMSSLAAATNAAAVETAAAGGAGHSSPQYPLPPLSFAPRSVKNWRKSYPPRPVFPALETLRGVSDKAADEYLKSTVPTYRTYLNFVDSKVAEYTSKGDVEKMRKWQDERASVTADFDRFQAHVLGRTSHSIGENEYQQIKSLMNTRGLSNADIRKLVAKVRVFPVNDLFLSGKKKRQSRRRRQTRRRQTRGRQTRNRN